MGAYKRLKSVLLSRATDSQLQEIIDLAGFFRPLLIAVMHKARYFWGMILCPLNNCIVIAKEHRYIPMKSRVLIERHTFLQVCSHFSTPLPFNCSSSNCTHSPALPACLPGSWRAWLFKVGEGALQAPNSYRYATPNVTSTPFRRAE